MVLVVEKERCPMASEEEEIRVGKINSRVVEKNRGVDDFKGSAEESCGTGGFRGRGVLGQMSLGIVEECLRTKRCRGCGGAP